MVDRRAHLLLEEKMERNVGPAVAVEGEFQEKENVLAFQRLVLAGTNIPFLFRYAQTHPEGHPPDLRSDLPF